MDNDDYQSVTNNYDKSRKSTIQYGLQPTTTTIHQMIITRLFAQGITV